jgi:hypothetical protein
VCSVELPKCLKQSHLEPINASVIRVTTLRIRGQLPATVANASKVCIPPYRSVSRGCSEARGMLLSRKRVGGVWSVSWLRYDLPSPFTSP